MDQKLSELVEELTTSGEPQLNPEKMKQLKKICKYVLRLCLSESVPTLGDCGATLGLASLLGKNQQRNTPPGHLPRALQCSVLFWGSSSRQGCS